MGLLISVAWSHSLIHHNYIFKKYYFRHLTFSFEIEDNLIDAHNRSKVKQAAFFAEQNLALVWAQSQEFYQDLIPSEKCIPSPNW